MEFSVSHATDCHAICSDGKVVNDFRTLSYNDRLVDELAGIDEKMGEDKADDLRNLTKHKYVLGMLGVAASLPAGREQEFMVYAKKVGDDDYKIQIDHPEFGQGLTEEEFKRKVDELLKANEKNAEEVKQIKKDAEVVYDILNSKLVKEVLGHAIEKKLSYEKGLLHVPVKIYRNVKFHRNNNISSVPLNITNPYSSKQPIELDSNLRERSEFISINNGYGSNDNNSNLEISKDSIYENKNE